ncbi:MAG: hypothetical protein HGA90_02175 [Alphaproteobacteria bacterium]|nr:hypothetical protein [Alphaproteobacteria bacterium]
MNPFSSDHRWPLALLGALLVLFIGTPLLHQAEENLTKKQNLLTQEKEKLQETLQQLREDAATAQQLDETLDIAEVDKLLAPLNRARATSLLEALARASRLDRFSYSLSPETPYRPATEGLAPTGLVTSALTLQGEAPHDGDITSMLDRLRLALPGRLQLHTFELERLRQEPEAAFAATNVRFTATLEWLTNENASEIHHD